MKALLKKLWNWIVSIPQDKLLHEKYGALICLFIFAILYRFSPVWLCFVVSDIVAVSVLALKELYDAHHAGHSVEIKDFLWGCWGAFKVNLAFLIMFI